MGLISQKLGTFHKTKAQFDELFQSDMVRYKQPVSKFTHNFHYYMRKAQCIVRPRFLARYYRKKYNRICNKYGLEIPYGIFKGKGLYINHPYNITINRDVVFDGDNINIHKGVTIGGENRGAREGCPIIKNRVWIGINACIVGKITIGNDVLIAANSYVNCDIPDHSIVFGNPCIIKHCDNATKDYINRTI